MKYYVIAGEASGDLHASELMLALRRMDGDAQFRCYGGDKMAAAGGTLVKHYRELAYMGFMPVLTHVGKILGNMRRAKRDISRWRPDAVILVDYPGFNLRIAKYVRKRGICPVYYYISPKIWAWKEYRIRNLRRDVDELFSILPFEVEYFERRHGYRVHYVGNPTVEEVRRFLDSFKVDELTSKVDELTSKRVDKLDDKANNSSTRQLVNVSTKRIIALLAGSRRQEIRDNLPAMVRVAGLFPEYEFVVAGAPGIEREFYEVFLAGTDVKLVHDSTYALLYHSVAALVTSGTATLETALMGVPQVVCYRTVLPRLVGWLRRRLLRVRYVSLVNLIADREVVRELVADSFSEANMERELGAILEGPAREEMLASYREVRKRLGEGSAAERAARIIVDKLTS